MIGGKIEFISSDARSKIVRLEEEREREIELAAKGINLKAQQEAKASSDKEAMMVVGTITVGVLIICLACAYLAVKVAEHFN
jgi:hypothetical protein